MILLAGLPRLAFAADKMTNAHIQEKLRADGYANVQITEYDKDHVDVKATKNWTTERLSVNPQTGAVTPNTDNDWRGRHPLKTPLGGSGAAEL